MKAWSTSHSFQRYAKSANPQLTGLIGYDQTSVILRGDSCPAVGRKRVNNLIIYQYSLDSYFKRSSFVQLRHNFGDYLLYSKVLIKTASGPDKWRFDHVYTERGKIRTTSADLNRKWRKIYFILHKARSDVSLRWTSCSYHLSFFKKKKGLKIMSSTNASTISHWLKK